MKYFHRNYFFPLLASALTTVLWSLTYTLSLIHIFNIIINCIMSLHTYMETNIFFHSCDSDWFWLNQYQRTKSTLSYNQQTSYRTGWARKSLDVSVSLVVVSRHRELVDERVCDILDTFLKHLCWCFDKLGCHIRIFIRGRYRNNMHNVSCYVTVWCARARACVQCYMKNNKFIYKNICNMARRKNFLYKCP